MAAPLSLIFQVYIHQKETKEQKVGLIGKDMKVGKVTEGVNIIKTNYTYHYVLKVSFEIWYL